MMTCHSQWHLPLSLPSPRAGASKAGSKRGERDQRWGVCGFYATLGCIMRKVGGLKPTGKTIPLTVVGFGHTQTAKWKKESNKVPFRCHGFAHYLRVVLPEQPPEPTGQPAGVFATTHWSVVVRAGDSRSPEAASAMERLCHRRVLPSSAWRNRSASKTARTKTSASFRTREWREQDRW